MLTLSVSKITQTLSTNFSECFWCIYLVSSELFDSGDNPDHNADSGIIKRNFVSAGQGQCENVASNSVNDD